jgi:hypothetical protein
MIIIYTATSWNNLWIMWREQPIDSFASPSEAADAVLDRIRNRDTYYPKESDIRFSALTEVPVSVIGHEIAAGRISKDEVLVIYEEDCNRHIAHYTDEGFLTDWPYGYYNWSMS